MWARGALRHSAQRIQRLADQGHRHGEAIPKKIPWDAVASDIAPRKKAGHLDTEYGPRSGQPRFRETRTYLKISKLPEEDADGRELDEAEEVDRVILPTNQ